MLTGFASGCPTDAHEELLLGFIPVYDVSNNMRATLPIQPVTGCGNQYWVFGADEQIQKILWISEGSFQNISVVLDPTRTSHSVFAEPNGTWSTAGGIDFTGPTFAMTSTNGKNVNASFAVSSEFIETYGDSGQLSNWVIDGLLRYSTLRPDSIRKTEAECDVTITSSGYAPKALSTISILSGFATIDTIAANGFSILQTITIIQSGSSLPNGSYVVTDILGPTEFTVATPAVDESIVSVTGNAFSGATFAIALSLNGQTLASGTSSIGFENLAIVEVAASGVSGTVDFSYSADITSGAFVTKRYAKSYSVTIGALSKTIPDNGLSEILSFTIGPLVVGSYTLLITPISDGGITGTPLTQGVTIGGAPVAPGVPVYVSGGSTATIISFAASTTPLATYRIYMPQEIGGPTFIETPATTHAAGTGTISVTLPSRTAAAGDMTIFVTSVLGGVESSYKKVKITYLADGSTPVFAGNIPSLSFSATPITSGRTINVDYSCDRTGQAAIPTKIQTQSKDEAGSTTTQTAFNIASFSGNLARGSTTIASGADGWFSVRIRSVTAGSATSDWSDWIGPIWCSNEVIAAVSGLTVNVVG